VICDLLETSHLGIVKTTDSTYQGFFQTQNGIQHLCCTIREAEVDHDVGQTNKRVEVVASTPESNQFHIVLVFQTRRDSLSHTPCTGYCNSNH
jgi:hypothetical protein